MTGTFLRIKKKAGLSTGPQFQDNLDEFSQR